MAAPRKTLLALAMLALAVGAATARPLDAASSPNSNSKPAEIAPGAYNPSFHYAASDIQHAFKLQLNTPYACKW